MFQKSEMYLIIWSVGVVTVDIVDWEYSIAMGDTGTRK